MSTVRDLLASSLKKIGALAQGEAMQAADAADGLTALNQMLGTWSNQRLLVFTVVREVFSLVAAQASYTMGTGANFATTRPQKIENASILIDTQEYPIDVLTKDQYAEVLLKSLQSDMPMAVYPSGTFPSETLLFYPVPASAYSVVLYSWKPISSFSSINDEVSFPPGFEEAIVYNLAIRLAPEYGKPISSEVAEIARTSLAWLKTMNFKTRLIKSDSPCVSAKPYNIYTGE